MDLANLDIVVAAGEGRDMYLRHPGTGEVSEVCLTVLGYDSEPVMDALRAAQKKLLAQNDKQKVEIEEALRIRKIAMAKAAVISVKGMTHGDASIDTPEALHKYLDEPGYSWMVDQINDFGSDRANLFTETLKG